MTASFDELKALLNLSDEIITKLTEYMADGSLSILEVIKLVVTEVPSAVSVGIHAGDLAKVSEMSKEEMAEALELAVALVTKIVGLVTKK
jgi:hypothetical protein